MGKFTDMDILVLTVLVAIFVIAILILVMVTATAKADKEVTIRGPLATLEEINRQIATKQAVLSDLEQQLKEQRKNLDSHGELHAEVGMLMRHREELLAEHGQLKERRKEVLDLRNETEAAHAAHAETQRNLLEARVALDRVESDLSQARRFAAEIDDLTKRHKGLSEEVKDLETRAAELKALLNQEGALRNQLALHEREVARNRGEISALESRKKHAETESFSLERRLNELKTELAEVATDRTARNLRKQELDEERERLREERARIKQQVDDPLQELSELPKVLSGHPSYRMEESEGEALERVNNHLREQGLHYPTRVINAFHTAMKVNETAQMAILAGISGTGKSELPRRYAHAMGINFLQVSVQPRWDSPQDLMGFYNYIEGRFRPTDMARALFRMDEWRESPEREEFQDQLLLILLDEMNLARVEYYFSDFLSRLESRPRRSQVSNSSLRKHAEIELDVPMPKGQQTPRIFPGYNLLFAGTMNEDESTQSLSEKVIDRANVLRFAAPNSVSSLDVASKEQADKVEGTGRDASLLRYSTWKKWLDSSSLGSGQSEVEDGINTILDLMKELRRPIGHRLGQAIMAYVACYPREASWSYRNPLADQIEMRILPRLRGIDMEMASEHLDTLRKFVEDQLEDLELAAAIEHSTRESREVGQFLWLGAPRE